MNRKLNYLLVISLLGVSLHAEVKEYNTEHIEQFQYQQGFKDGARKAYKEGYRDALRFAKKQLRLWAKTIKAYEAGKYLKEYDKKITNPAIYQSKQGNTVKVIVRGCRIERQLSPDEILELPMYPIDTTGNGKFDYTNMDASDVNIFDKDTFTNSGDIVARDGDGFYSSRPTNPFTNNASFLYFPNTEQNRKKLTVLNYNYTIEDNKIKVIFRSKEERQFFIQKLNK